VGDPLAFVFGPQGANVSWISGIIAASAVVALFTVLLVFQLGQPRIWMVMSRDGLLPKIFSSIHPKYKTPWFSTIVTGLFVGIPSLFMNLTEVTDLTSIGTLFAFLLVCAGVLKFDPHRPKEPGKFRIPYVNGKWILPSLMVIALVLAFVFNKEGIQTFWTNGGWEVNKHKIPFAGYCIGMLYLAYLTFRNNFSLIPVLGLTSCGYLIYELGWTNWVRFLVWLVVGLAIYFMYGIKNSKLKT
jgi:amino acid transporter